MILQSVARFRALAQATGQIYWVADAEGHLTDTAAWCAFTGQKLEEAIGEGWAAHVHPEDRQHMLTAWATAVTTGQPYRHEHRVRRAGGDYRMMLAQAYPVLAPDSTVSEWVGVDTDVTLLQELRADVQVSQEEFRATFDLAAVGMAHVLPDGRILRANRMFCAILGYSQEELLGRSFQELTYAPDLDANLAILERLLAGVIPTYTLEKRYLRKDGSLVWVNLTGSLKRHQDGTPEYGIAVIEDISARKAAEEALRQSEQQYRQLFETMAQGVMYYSPSGEILSANPAALHVLGLTPARIQGQTTQQNDWQVIGEDGAVISRAAIPTMRAARTGQEVSEVVEVFNPQDHHERWLQVTAIPEFHPGEQTPYRVFATFEDITGQRRLEKELQTHVQELEAIFASMNDGLIVHRADGAILRSNPAYVALIGWPADSPFYTLPRKERRELLQIRDALGQPIPLEELPLSQSLRGLSVTQEQIFRNHAGQDFHVLVRGAPLIDAAGRVIGTVEVVHDITEQRRLERVTTAQARELEAIFASMNDGLIVFRGDGSVLRLNPAYAALVGWSAGSELYALSPEERRQTLQIRDNQGALLSPGFFPLDQVFRGELLAAEHIVRRRDGRDVYVSVRGAPLIDASGQIEGAVMVLHDITERQQLEHQTQQALQALLRMAELLVQYPLESEEQTSLLVGQHLAELACTLLGCPIATILTLDPQTLSMQVIGTVGYTPEQEAHLHAIIVAWTHRPPDLAEIQRLMGGETLVMDATQPPYQEFATLFDIRQVVVAPMQLGGQLVGMVVFNPSKLTQRFTDQQIALAGATAQLVGLVVERERLFRQREEAHTSALAERETARQMSDFLNLIGHELRNPLTSLKGQIQLAQRQLARLQASEDALAGATVEMLAARLGSVEEMLQRLRLPIWQLERLISDLVEAAQLQRGQFTLAVRPCDLALVVRNAVEEQRAAWPERAIDLLLPNLEEVVVRADAERVGQVVTNYLINALKYTPPDSPVAVILGVETGQAHLRVRDHGPGISLEEQAHIWEQFHRGQGVDTAGGLGLGLYLCKQLIERQNGQVGLESQMGVGSTFWFRLPLAAAPA